MDSPLLGTIESPWKDVEYFYKFWREFKSWRIYNAFDEYNPDVGYLIYNEVKYETFMHRRQHHVVKNDG